MNYRLIRDAAIGLLVFLVIAEGALWLLHCHWVNSLDGPPPEVGLKTYSAPAPEATPLLPTPSRSFEEATEIYLTKQGGRHATADPDDAAGPASTR